MTETPQNKLTSLIKMLDDPDERVQSVIADNIIGFGREALSPLEHALENCFDAELESRIKYLISGINRNQRNFELSDWLSSGAEDLFRGFIIVSRTKFPDLDEVEIASILAQIKTDVWIELNDDLTALENIKVINHVFFNVHRFEPNRENISDPDNSYINTLLQNRKGSPLTLGILYMLIAGQLDIPIVGVNLPQHFIVAYLRETGIIRPTESDILFYINPFNRGAVFSRREIDQFIGQMKIKPEKSFYSPCSNRDIILRLINNLIFSYQSRGMNEEQENIKNLLTLFE